MDAFLPRLSRDGRPRIGPVLVLLATAWTALPLGLATAADLQYRAGAPSDRDGDGVGNALDADDDNDLIADDDEPPGDSDGDGIPNGFDVDADNDGIADLLEAVADPALLARLDANGDGRLDDEVAIGENGLATIAETAPGSGRLVTGRLDSDGDGVTDPHDLDSDDDGLVDLLEAGGVDADGDGRVDRFRDLDGDGRDDQLALFPIVPRDSDGDGALDFRDRDSDGDGASDRLESSGVDTDGDGVVDGRRDLNGDGLDDGVAAAPVRPIDGDGDGRPDHLDPDTVPASAPPPTPPPAVVTPPTPTPPVAPVVPDDGGGQPIDAGSAGPDLGTESGTGGGTGRPVTGRAGNAIGGCSVGSPLATSPGAADPSLVALSLIALGVVLVRGRSTRRRAPPVAAVTVLALVLAGCASLPVPGELRSIERFHAGVGLGASRLDADTDGTPFAVDERRSGGAQLMAGATLAPWLDAEVRASDLGELGLVGGGAIGYQVLDVGAVLRRRLGRADVFARAGLGALFNDGGVDVDRRNDVHVLLGAGVDVPFASDWRVRLEGSGHDVDALQAGLALVYRFGRRGRPPPVAATAPAIEPFATESPAAVSIDDGSSVARAAAPATPRPTIEPAPPPDVATRPDAAPLPDIVPRSGETPRPDIAARSDPVPRPDIAPRPAGTPPFSSTAESDDAALDPLAPPDAVGSSPSDLAPSDPSPAEADAFDADDYDIRFEADSERLTEESRRAIGALAEAMDTSPDIELSIVTRSDTGGDEQAELLSRRRALAVVRALGEAGVDVSRLRPEIHLSTETDVDAESGIRLLER